MSILNTLFGQQPQQAPQQQQAPAPQPQQQQAPQPAQDNNTVPNATNSPTHNEGESPLANYADLWDNFGKPNEEGNLLNFDKDKLGDLAGQMNFASTIKPEQFQAVAQGGEEATKALSDILNAVARQSYLNSTETTTHLLNSALKNSKDDIFSKLPDHVKKLDVSANLSKQNPMLNNPAVKPILTALESQLSAKYPNASAEEITQHAQTYLTELSGVFNPASKEQAPKIPDGQDFSSYL